MIDMNKLQQDLDKWRKEQFPGNAGHPEQFVLGMAEEVGEVAHMVLKSMQRYREGINGMTDEVKAEIVDGIHDTIIYGLGLLSELKVNFEDGFHRTVYEVLHRNWNKVREESNEKA